MVFDGIMTRAVVEELKYKIIGGSVKKINQIGKRQLTFQIYVKGTNLQLYISADTSNAKFHLTNRKYENPKTPPNFLMLLRKHIGQSKIIGIRQIGLDRTVIFDFLTHNELGDEVTKHLILEIMGKHSNIILLNENNVVIDAVQRVSHSMSRVRQIYPGKEYVPFLSDKFDILNLSKDESENNSIISTINLSFVEKDVPISKVIYQNITGFSPLINMEICVRANVDPVLKLSDLSECELTDFNKVFSDISKKIIESKFEPSFYVSDKPAVYCVTLIHKGDTAHTAPSISELIDKLGDYEGRDDKVGNRKNELQSILKHIIDKQEKKLNQLEKDYKETLDREAVKEAADLLTANIYNIKKGMNKITVSDFYHDNIERIIELDEKKGAWENINELYRKHTKLKRANSLLSESIPKLQEELAYYHQLALTIQDADELSVLNDIKNEFIKEKLIEGKKSNSKNKDVLISKNKKSLEQKSSPYKFKTKNGLMIFVGRNNVQNDYLTLKVANKDDIFLHSKTIPGAHVILKVENKTPSAEDIETAAWLAAKYSSNKDEPYVDIDYTEKKNVYKAKGAKPGMVYYNNYKTLHINTEVKPDFETVV